MVHIRQDIGENFSLEDIAKKVKAFCQKHPIEKLEVFGSRVQGTAKPESDIDLLVTFQANAQLTSLDLVAMQIELKEILGCEVDFIEKNCVEKSSNRFRKNSILKTTKEIYAV